MATILTILVLVAIQVAVAEAQPAPEATSLLGRPLVPAPPPADRRLALDADLAKAEAALAAAPDSADALIWVGRRQAYLGRYRAAIETFSRGVERFPTDARFLRHRGHRYLTVRDLARAEADLARAAALVRGRPDEIEPDGQPNARNIPTSTLQFNIWYHLGLARYADGRVEAALEAYRRCLEVSANPDSRVATLHWLYMTLRRLGREEEAARAVAGVSPDLEIVENRSYHRLVLFYRGLLSADTLEAQAGEALDAVTVGYGLANWHFYSGRQAEARQRLEKLVHGPQWPAFGSLAAEADLSRMR
jgi:tetratricopeptide (TPR) repeat protein